MAAVKKPHDEKTRLKEQEREERMPSARRLRQLRLEANFKSTAAAAEAFGWKATTVASHENTQSAISRKAAEKYAAAYAVEGRTAEWILFGGESEAQIVAYTDRANILDCLGVVEAGAFRRPDAPAYREASMFVADPRFRKEDQFALRVRGDSMNAAEYPIRDGDMVKCLSVKQSGIDPRPGDIVVVERVVNGMVETSLKRAARVNGYWEFRPESTNPAHETLAPGKFEEETISVSAIVLEINVSLRS